MVKGSERRKSMDNGASSYHRFLDGDDSGFVEIIKQYKDGLILYLSGITGNVHLAEDLAEDTFVKIITKKPGFSGRSTFKTWLYAIGRNVAKDYLRRHKNMVEISREELCEIKSDEQLLEKVYIKEEEKIELHRAMDKLSTDYRQVLWLCYFEELSCKEAARVMGKSVHNIETMLYRARKSLRTQLDKEGFVYEGL